MRRGPLVRTLRVNGVIEDDDTRHRILAARVPGRVEKLGVNFVGAEVEEGALLATIYSPEMLTAQRQYVERLKAGTTAFTVSERATARERLLELGLTEEEINILEHTLEPVAMVNVRAPMSGTVVSRAVYEGQYVQTNDRLFEIGDFSSMWFVFDAYEPDLAWIRPGQTVDIVVPSLPGQILTAPVAFIDPNLNEATRTAKVRVVLDNHDRALLHKQTAQGRVRLETPDDAARSPQRRPATRSRAGRLRGTSRSRLSRRARSSSAGSATPPWKSLAGLKDGERVATQGGLILDSQAQLARAAVTGEHDHAPAAPTRVSAADRPRRRRLRAVEQLRTLAFAAADAGRLLADDDLAGYQRNLPVFRAALQAYLAADERAGHGALEQFRSALPDRADLRSARRDFEPFSTAVADLARASQVNHRAGGLHVFECPMTPVLGTGRWLSRETTAHNPFFGSAMPECGAELK